MPAGRSGHTMVELPGEGWSCLVHGGCSKGDKLCSDSWVLKLRPIA